MNEFLEQLKCDANVDGIITGDVIQRVWYLDIEKAPAPPPGIKAIRSNAFTGLIEYISVECYVHPLIPYLIENNKAFVWNNGKVYIDDTYINSELILAVSKFKVEKWYLTPQGLMTPARLVIVL